MASCAFAFFTLPSTLFDLHVGHSVLAVLDFVGWVHSYVICDLNGAAISQMKLHQIMCKYIKEEFNLRVSLLSTAAFMYRAGF